MSSNNDSSPFVFATAQYESGDWDSAPLVPAQHHRLDRALHVASRARRRASSSRCLPTTRCATRCCILTGHLPVRFTRAGTARCCSDTSSAAACCSWTITTTTSTARFTRRRPRRSRASSGRCVPLPNDHALYSRVLQVRRWPAHHEPRAEWLGRQPRAQDICSPCSAAIASRCCTATRTTARSGAIIPTTSAFSRVDNTRFAVNLVVYALTR